jgi:hypothetical protein
MEFWYSHNPCRIPSPVANILMLGVNYQYTSQQIDCINDEYNHGYSVLVA